MKLNRGLIAAVFTGLSIAAFAAPTNWVQTVTYNGKTITMRLTDGFIAGVEQRHGLGAILRAEAFLFSGLSILDVLRAAELASFRHG